MELKDTYIAIQEMLRTKKLYKGLIDGEIDDQTLVAIRSLVNQHPIEPGNWNRARLLIAAEQILYKEAGIEVGEIDGYVGPMTQHARDLYQAKTIPVWRSMRDQIAAFNEKLKAKNVQTSETVDIAPKIVSPVRAKFDSPREKDCMKFYGKPGTRQVDCQLPFPMVIAWNTRQRINSYKCHELVKEPMERLWNRTLEHYGLEQIQKLRLNYFGGCLNVRKKRGGDSWSMHSWGIAVDIDPDRNALRTSKKYATLARPEYDKFWQFVYDEGAISLGKERDYDWMHFQWAKF